MQIEYFDEKFQNEIAECVGLWLAEGDKITSKEINFCNNCEELVIHFHNTLVRLFNIDNFKIRIYIYTPKGELIEPPIKNTHIKRYIKSNATKPYFVWRIGSVKLVSEWKQLVETISKNKKYYQPILKGFFAGEGNIKTGSHNNRTIRISQGKRIKFLEQILAHFKITWSYAPRERSYVITSKDNWDKCEKLGLANLHPLRKVRFYEAYNSFQEEHYCHSYLKKEFLKILITPRSCNQLSIRYKRSFARIQDVLVELKKEDLIENFRVGSVDYWIRKDKNKIIISQLKRDYLNFLGSEEKPTSMFNRHFDVDWKSSYKRLKELEKLGLVERLANKKWKRLYKNKVLIVLW